MRSTMRSLALALLLLPATLAATQTITVSGGDRNNAPYYTFDGGAPPTLVVGTTYEFDTWMVSGIHSFAIHADGNVVSGSFTVAEGTTYEYVCLNHGSMTATFTISEGVDCAPGCPPFLTPSGSYYPHGKDDPVQLAEAARTLRRRYRCPHRVE